MTSLNNLHVWDVWALLYPAGSAVNGFRTLWIEGVREFNYLITVIALLRKNWLFCHFYSPPHWADRHAPSTIQATTFSEIHGTCHYFIAWYQFVTVDLTMGLRIWTSLYAQVTVRAQTYLTDFVKWIGF